MLIAVGALIGVISLFMDWTQGATLWQLYTLLDVVTVLLGLVTIALCAAGFAAPRMPYLRAALIPPAMFFALPALVTAIEFLVTPGDVEVGAIVGLVAALIATAGLAVLVASDLVARRSGRRLGMATVLVGLGAAAFVALFVTIAQLLPTVEAVATPAGEPGFGDSLSEWQVAKVTDWFDQLLVLALLALAVAAVALRQVPAVSLALGVLLAYFALPDLLLALDDMLNGGTFYAADVMSVMSGAVALAGSLFLATNALVAGE